MVSRVPLIPSLGLCLVLALAACGDALSDSGGTTADAIVGFDTSSGVDVVNPADTLRPGLDADSGGPDVAQAGLVALKSDADWLVPGSVVARTAVAVAGARVAWVEAPVGGPAELVVWDTGQPDAALRSYRVPNLAHPRQLALGEAALVYVDDRYGDPDLFVLDLVRGTEAALVARAGAQEHPVVAGGVVAWADCRACVGGDDGAGREIYRRPLAGGSEERVTDDGVRDDRPALGTLADGAPALAWVTGDTQVRVVGAGTDATLDTGRPVAGIALTQGVLAFRAPPFIINPDSMRPSDVRLWDVASGAIVAATFHAELPAGVDGAPRAADGRVAWLDGVPGAAGEVRLTVADPTGAPILVTTIAGAVTTAVSGARVAVLAPRADNDGLLDLWIRELP